MYIGFHASSLHSPKSALLRALCTHAPSSCQTMPTVVTQGGSAVGNASRRASAPSAMTSIHAAKPRAPSVPGVLTACRSVAARCRILRPARLDVVRAQPAGERRRLHEERRRVVDVGRPVVLLQGDDGRAIDVEVGQQALGAVAGPPLVEPGDHRPAPEEARRAGAVGFDVGGAGEAEDEDAIGRQAVRGEVLAERVAGERRVLAVVVVAREIDVARHAAERVARVEDASARRACRTGSRARRATMTTSATATATNRAARPVPAPQPGSTPARRPIRRRAPAPGWPG